MARNMSSICIHGGIGFRPSFEGKARNISHVVVMNTVVGNPKIVASANVSGVSLAQSRDIMEPGDEGQSGASDTRLAS